MGARDGDLCVGKDIHLWYCRRGLRGYLMPDMDSMTEATGIDVEVMVTEVPGQSVSMMESGEEVEVHKLPAALAPKPVAWDSLPAPAAEKAVLKWGRRANEEREQKGRVPGRRGRDAAF